MGLFMRPGGWASVCLIWYSPRSMSSCPELNWENNKISSFRYSNVSVVQWLLRRALLRVRCRANYHGCVGSSVFWWFSCSAIGWLSGVFALKPTNSIPATWPICAVVFQLGWESCAYRQIIASFQLFVYICKCCKFQINLCKFPFRIMRNNKGGQTRNESLIGNHLINPI